MKFNFKKMYAPAVLAAEIILMPTLAFADLGGMLRNLQGALLSVLAPILCIGGIIYSGCKLAMGDESAKKMLLWSCIGTVVTFTAPSLLSFLQTQVAA